MGTGKRIPHLWFLSIFLVLGVTLAPRLQSESELVQSSLSGIHPPLLTLSVNEDTPLVDQLTPEEQKQAISEVISNMPEVDYPRLQPVEVSAENGLIAHVGMDGFLYMIDPDSSAQMSWVTDIENIVSPAWSPDEVSLAFAGDGENSRCLYKLHVSNRSRKQLTCGFHNIWEPRWSPKGDYLAFWGQQAADEAAHSWVVSTGDGPSPAIKLGPDLLEAITPDWIDDQTVVIAGKATANVWHIYRVDVSQPDELTPITQEISANPCGGTFASYPTLSPDGQYVAFLRARFERTSPVKEAGVCFFSVYTTHLPEYPNQTWIADVADTSQTGGAGAGAMRWTADSQRLGLLASGSDNVLRLNIVNPSDGGVNVLHGREGGGWAGWDWSPDGDLMAAGYLPSGGEWELDIVEPGSDTFTPLAQGYQPAWSTQLPMPEPFLELPFGYDCSQSDTPGRFGGTPAAFNAAVNQWVRPMRNAPPQCNSRITAGFDHEYPLGHPRFQGIEPPQYGESMVIYIGERVQHLGYSGHNAFDFSPFIPDSPTTPVFAAADGFIKAAGNLEDGYYVEIQHADCTTHIRTGYITRYWHLHEDEYYEQSQQREGDCISAAGGNRIGTMGNTGIVDMSSGRSGIHLHFELFFDTNGNGLPDKHEILDPFGFMPTAEIPFDPWVEGVQDTPYKDTPYKGSASHYLWIHPLHDALDFVPGEAEASLALPAGNATLSLPANAFAQPSHVRFQALPDYLPGLELASGRHTVGIYARQGNGQFHTQFLNPATLTILYSAADTAELRPQTLAIYWRNQTNGTWEYVASAPPPTVGVTSAAATATVTVAVTRTGTYALMGQPIEDLIPPVTEITVVGTPVGISDLYDGPFTIALQATDLGGSGLAGTEYSLDSGMTWLPYTGPLTFEANSRVFFLARSYDNIGNLETPAKWKTINMAVERLYLPITSK